MIIKSLTEIHVLCSCDVCGTEFEKYRKSCKEYQFCSRKCVAMARKANGILAQRCKETCLKRYGVENAGSSALAIEKRRLTMLERYGVECAFASGSLRDIGKLTMLERYGAENPMQSFQIREKIEQTNLKRYGAKNPYGSQEIIERKRQRCLEKRGVDHPMKDPVVKETLRNVIHNKYGVDCTLTLPEIREKIKKTNLERFGVEHNMQNADVKQRSSATCFKHFGVSWPMQSSSVKNKVDYHAAYRKRHETMKKSGSYGKSKLEDRFYEALCKAFRTDDVERQVLINKWSIDFYVKSINTYVQFDGVYWHGLDRPIETIVESCGKRDMSILKNFRLDRVQDVWFAKNNMKLVRITDREFKSNGLLIFEKF